MANESVPLHKIDDFRWEIPASGGMRVPGRIYASEKLLEHIQADKAPEQCANVAHLPGIVKYSIAMPDIHWGYGFPIGGVAAFDPDEGGVISPGGVGYDINCLDGDTPVLCAEGYTRSIREIVEERLAGQDVVLFDEEERRCVRASVDAGMGRRPHRPTFEVTTESGRRIVATSDHPFLTPAGMRELAAITAGDRVAIVPFEGVPYERPGSEVLADEASLRAAAGGCDPAALRERIEHVRHLLPLTQDHPALPLVLKIAGYAAGSGTNAIRSKRGHVVLGGTEDDLERLASEVRAWFPEARVRSLLRLHSIDTTHGRRSFRAPSHELVIPDHGFALLLAALGTPAGTDEALPGLVRTAPRWQQRLYLAAFLGAALSRPRVCGEDAEDFDFPIIGIEVPHEEAEHGIRFIEAIGRLLEEFAVRPIWWALRASPHGSRRGRTRVSLGLSNDPSSLVALWGRVGFEIDSERRALGLLATAYLRARAAPAGAAAAVHAGVRVTPSATTDAFPSYEEWRDEATIGLGSSGVVWDVVAAIREHDPPDRVWDVRIDHRDHNFVAAGFVVHN